jgi:hypothetical protein
MPMPRLMHSGDLGTAATCHEVTGGAVAGIVCGNFAQPRELRVNDEVWTFQDGTNWGCGMMPPTPPPLRNGGYCFETTAGNNSFAYFLTY